MILIHMAEPAPLAESDGWQGNGFKPPATGSVAYCSILYLQPTVVLSPKMVAQSAILQAGVRTESSRLKLKLNSTLSLGVSLTRLMG